MESIEITREELAAAIEQWDSEATSEKWPERTDAERFRDNADYLFDVILSKRAA